MVEQQLFFASNKKQLFSLLSSKPLKLIDSFTYLDSSISSTESNVNVRIEKAY